MARQKGPVKLKGSMGEYTFYQMGGQHLVRKKTSLNKQRVKTDPVFANSRKASTVFARAAAIAKEVYQALPKEKRKHGLIGRLTGIANRWLHEGKSENEIKRLLGEWIETAA